MKFYFDGAGYIQASSNDSSITVSEDDDPSKPEGVTWYKMTLAEGETIGTGVAAGTYSILTSTLRQSFATEYVDNMVNSINRTFSTTITAADILNATPGWDYDFNENEDDQYYVRINENIIVTPTQETLTSYHDAGHAAVTPDVNKIYVYRGSSTAEAYYSTTDHLFHKINRSLRVHLWNADDELFILNLDGDEDVDYLKHYASGKYLEYFKSKYVLAAEFINYSTSIQPGIHYLTTGPNATTKTMDFTQPVSYLSNRVAYNTSTMTLPDIVPTSESEISGRSFFFGVEGMNAVIYCKSDHTSVFQGLMGGTVTTTPTLTEVNKDTVLTLTNISYVSEGEYSDGWSIKNGLVMLVLGEGGVFALNFSATANTIGLNLAGTAVILFRTSENCTVTEAS